MNKKEINKKDLVSDYTKDWCGFWIRIIEKLAEMKG